VRLVLKTILASYVRTTVIGAERLPQLGPYIICFNHPSWLDPLFLAAMWPDRERRLYIFGPREEDMGRGWRNQLITWTRRGVPFKPGSQDVIDLTRRAVAVLRAGACLAVAGEGRLSDHEGRILPLETGLAHFARLADAPLVPTAIVGTRWIHLGSRVRIEIGEPVHHRGFRRGKAGAADMTAVVQDRLQRMLDGVVEREPPGRLGRMISDAFDDRPWLDAEAGPDDVDRDGSSAAGVPASRDGKRLATAVQDEDGVERDP
jgi:1-acyl-sn-glycerol-3-phosphate acyltransferase